MAVLTGAAAPGFAFTLGDLRGSVLIGRSLDVSVPVVPGPGEEALSSCLAAEVLYSDTQQVSSVTVTPVMTGSVPSALVRIKASAVVDEPVVSVLLRATCGVATTRRYVVLPDFPAPDLPKAVATSAVGNVTQAPATPLNVPQQSAIPADATPHSAAPSPGLSEERAAKPPTAVARVIKPKQVVKKPARPAMPAKPAPAPEPAVAKPVLKLDPQPVLPIQGAVSVPAAVSASAAAPVLSDEAVLQALHIQVLQNDVKTLKDLAAKNQASLAEFQSKLRRAEAERVPLSWFYLVIGLLVAALGALAWVLRKQQQTHKADWWQHAQTDAPETVVITPSSTLQPVAPVSEPASDFGKFVTTHMLSATTVPPSTLAELDPDLDIDLSSLSPADETSPAAESLALVQEDSFGAGRNINVENISDIRQQAEFFVSLGQTDRALNILRKQILESTEPNPLVYLDLLSLYHAQGLKADFRELRSAFNQFFNVVAPDFPAFSQEGRDLLAYTEPLAVLSRFWPNIEAIAFLEACIFHNDAAPMQLSFDLAAFRDLLMLHAVAEKVTSDSPWKMTSHGGLGMSSAAHAEIAELAMTLRGQFDEAKTGETSDDTLDTRGDSEAALAAPVTSPPAPGLDLDLDLDLDAPNDTENPIKQNPSSAGGGTSGKSPFRNSLF